MIIINESGLYSLIFSSKLDKAKEFKRWVTKEVLMLFLNLNTLRYLLYLYQ
jgi:prophage antirepressor-like protein